MFFYYDNIGVGKVAFYTDIFQKYENFNYLEYSPSNEELLLIQQNYDLFVRDGILIFEKPERIKNEEIKQQKANKTITILDKKAEIQDKIINNTLTMNDLVEYVMLL